MSLLGTLFRARPTPGSGPTARGSGAKDAGHRAPRQASVKANPRRMADDADDWTSEEPGRRERARTPVKDAAPRDRDAGRSAASAVLKSSRVQATRPAASGSSATRARPAQSLGEASARARTPSRQHVRDAHGRPAARGRAAPASRGKPKGIGTFKMLAIMATCAAVGSWLGIGLQNLVSGSTGPTQDIYRQSVVPATTAPTSTFTF